MSNELFKQPVELPSKGWYYPEKHPLSSGMIEIYAMTAQHEDILTSRNLIAKGVVLDKLLEALIATVAVKYDDLLIGDKNAVMVAARVLGYGKDYQAKIDCPSCGETVECTIDLEQISDVKMEFDASQRGKNEFLFNLPLCGREITFRLLTNGDERAVRRELESLKKGLKSEVSKEVTTRMRYAIVAVDGDRERDVVRKFVDQMPARDAVAFREHAKNVNPNVDMTFDFECPKCGHEQRLEVPIDVTFFWPYAGI